MKKLIISLIAIVALMISIPVFAMDNYKSVTVEEIQNLQDDDLVKLKGNITLRLDEESFLFKDDTGQTKIEIYDDIWNDRNIDPDQVYIIKGEIEKDEEIVYVEVEHLMEVDAEEHKDNEKQDN